MTLYTLKRNEIVPAPIGQVFEFFRKPENLGRITPGWLGFQMLTPLPLEMGRGSLIEYAIHLFGVPLRWTTLITAFDPPSRFVDEQLRGPYSFWHHTHAFRDLGGRTEMTDTVHYAMRFGILGRIVHALWVRRQIEHIFSYRGTVMRSVFPDPSSLPGRPEKEAR